MARGPVSRRERRPLSLSSPSPDPPSLPCYHFFRQATPAKLAVLLPPFSLSLSCRLSHSLSCFSLLLTDPWQQWWSTTMVAHRRTHANIVELEGIDASEDSSTATQIKCRCGGVWLERGGAVSSQQRIAVLQQVWWLAPTSSS